LLGILVAGPAHQGRGAGIMLLESGTEQDDQEGLECESEASRAGRKLHERFRCRTTKEKSVHFERCADEREAANSVTIRPGASDQQADAPRSPVSRQRDLHLWVKCSSDSTSPVRRRTSYQITLLPMICGDSYGWCSCRRDKHRPSERRRSSIPIPFLPSTRG